MLPPLAAAEFSHTNAALRRLPAQVKPAALRSLPSKSFFKYCKGAVANSDTGSTIYGGAPIGSAAGLTALLTGKAAPPINERGYE
jgi:hypothetical protein